MCMILIRVPPPPPNSSKIFCLIFSGFPNNFPAILPDNIQIFLETSTRLPLLKLNRNKTSTTTINAEFNYNLKFCQKYYIFPSF